MRKLWCTGIEIDLSLALGAQKKIIRGIKLKNIYIFETLY